MDDDKFRRFEHVINLHIYYVSRKLEWARRQLDHPGARDRVLNEAIDEIAARLAELDIAVAAIRDQEREGAACHAAGHVAGQGEANGTGPEGMEATAGRGRSRSGTVNEM